MTPTTASTLELLRAIELYFQGEKVEALVFILPMGLLSLVFGIWLFSDSPSSFTKAVAIPCLVMGLVMTAVGSVVGFRTPSQVAQLQQAVQTDFKPTLATESARMEKVNEAWSKYLFLWGLMGALGLGLRFAASGDFAHGLGIALVFFSGVGLMVDGFAERRAHAYATFLEKENGLAPGVSAPVTR